MSYTKHTWTDGELVTAAKMNNIENGIEEASSGGSGGGGVLVVHATPSDDAITLDKTWQEIKDADAVSVVFDNTLENARSFFFCSSVFERVRPGGGEKQYVVRVRDFDNAQNMDFIASSASGYPSYTE